MAFSNFSFLSCVYIGDVKRDIARCHAPYLLTLANRNNPNCVTSPQGGQGKYSQVSLSLTVSLINVANVNDPLMLRAIAFNHIVMLEDLLLPDSNTYAGGMSGVCFCLGEGNRDFRKKERLGISCK